jgi:hypothetical protein
MQTTIKKYELKCKKVSAFLNSAFYCIANGQVIRAAEKRYYNSIYGRKIEKLGVTVRDKELGVR